MVLRLRLCLSFHEINEIHGRAERIENPRQRPTSAIIFFSRSSLRTRSNFPAGSYVCFYFFLFRPFRPVQLVPGLFNIGYFPITIFFQDISPSDKCLPEFLPIMDFYPLCFAHQEKTLPGLIPITILPIYLWIFTYHIFVHHRIAHQTRIN